MKAPRPPRWQRKVEHRRALTRRMLAAGALLGLIGGLVGQLAVEGHVDEDMAGLVRVALVVPAAIFVAWWIAFPGVGLDRDDAEPIEPVTADVEVRIERIEAAFDAEARPRSRFSELEPADEATRQMFRRSIRRVEPTTSEDLQRYAIRRTADGDPKREEG